MDSYAINGTALSSLMTVNRVDGGIHAPVVMQEDYLVPGRVGAVATRPWIGPSPLTIYGTIIGSTRADFIAKARAVTKAMFNSGNPSTITRTITLPTGGTETTTASVRYVSGLEAIEQMSDRVARVAVEFTMLSGTWSDQDFTETNPKSGTFSVTIPGDQIASDVIVTFTGGTGQKLTNTTRDSFVELATVVTVGTPVILNSIESTVTQGTVDVSDKLTFAPPLLMSLFVLNPGVNKFTLTGGGSVTLKYKGAYL